MRYEVRLFSKIRPCTVACHSLLAFVKLFDALPDSLRARLSSRIVTHSSKNNNNHNNNNSKNNNSNSNSSNNNNNSSNSNNNNNSNNNIIVYAWCL